MNRGMTGVNSLPMTVTRQRRSCDLNPGPTAPESSTLTARLPSRPPCVECSRPVFCRVGADAGREAAARWRRGGDSRQRNCWTARRGGAVGAHDRQHVSRLHVHLRPASQGDATTIITITRRVAVDLGTHCYIGSKRACCCLVSNY